MARLFVIDTETGGIDPDVHSILSLAGVVWCDGMLEAELEIKIAEPVMSITGQAMRINRIDLVEHAVDARSPVDAAKRLRAFLRKHFQEELKSGAKITLAGHNIGFDVGFLRRLCRMGAAPFEELFSHRSLDTSSILRFLMLSGRADLRGAGLEEALHQFGIVVPEASRHTALGDARATAALLNALIEMEREPARLRQTKLVDRTQESFPRSRKASEKSVKATNTRSARKSRR